MTFRVLPDACETCLYSVMACCANRAHNGQPCCPTCRHPEP
jgi:hypothetical protein